ncbi:MAG: MarR family transcriptional regulator [Alphaproteobacteria bacterium]|nr:MarR family transcriptional regulator [Alphaproteobacteria bacterium]
MLEKQILGLQQVIETCTKVDKCFPLQYIKCLLFIYEKGGMGISELAEVSELGISTTSRIVHSLADRRQNNTGYHFVMIVNDQNNGRKRQIFLTPKGKVFVENLLNCF